MMKLATTTTASVAQRREAVRELLPSPHLRDGEQVPQLEVYSSPKAEASDQVGECNAGKVSALPTGRQASTSVSLEYGEVEG